MADPGPILAPAVAGYHDYLAIAVVGFIAGSVVLGMLGAVWFVSRRLAGITYLRPKR